MKRVVIVAPQFPPSNLTAVHRSRFHAMYLKRFGWEPIILTLKPKYYKEKLDHELEKMLPNDLEIIRTKAFKANRLIGDTSIRGFLWFWKELRILARKRKIDFLLIAIPPNYSSLLGRLIYEEFKIPYGIDYIDPWIKKSKGRIKSFTKSWLSQELAKILEPIAIKRASLISGVAKAYFLDVIKRNNLDIETLAIPYGIEKDDHKIAEKLNKKAYIFRKDKDIFNFVYVGAMLPKAYTVLRTFFKSLKKLEKENSLMFKKIRIYFIGTGKSPDDARGFNIKPVAEEFNLYETTVFEHPARIPYLDVLVHLKETDAILVIGSTEKHYTASKIFQAVFSKRPVLALLHKESSTVEFLNKSNAGKAITFTGEGNLDNIVPEICRKIEEVMTEKFDESKIDYSYFDQFTAKASARRLADAMDKVVMKK